MINYYKLTSTNIKMPGKKGGKSKQSKQNNQNNAPVVKYGPGKICLNMIVKNEEKVMERCLNNHEHLIDAVAIVDTGSSDKTIEIIVKWCQKRKLPCEVIVDPWRDDFGYSRTAALRHGEAFVEKIKKKEVPFSPDDNGEIWYLCFADADNVMFSLDSSSPIEVKKNRMGADAYRVEMRSYGSSYDYLWMVKVNPDKQWKWYSPVHEYVDPLKNEKGEKLWQPHYEKLTGGFIESRREGARSLDPDRYMRDSVAFEKALLDDPMNDRYLYYLGQSYRDAASCYQTRAEEAKKKSEAMSKGPLPLSPKEEEEKKKLDLTHNQLIQKAAILLQRGEKAFIYRASVQPFNTWNDEYTYNAWLEAGRLRLRRKSKYDSKSIEYFMKAHEKRPHRLEGAYYVLHHYLQCGLHKMGWSLAKDLVNLPYPEGEIIFVDQSIHKYSFAFEASLCAYYAGNKAKFVDLSNRVIECASTPDNIRSAAKQNLEKFGK